jgi:hypothetical protein
LRFSAFLRFYLRICAFLRFLEAQKARSKRASKRRNAQTRIILRISALQVFAFLRFTFPGFAKQRFAKRINAWKCAFLRVDLRCVEMRKRVKSCQNAQFAKFNVLRMFCEYFALWKQANSKWGHFRV